MHQVFDGLFDDIHGLVSKDCRRKQNGKKVSVLIDFIKNEHKSIFNAFDHDISLRSLVFKLEERYMLFFLAFFESYGFTGYTRVLWLFNRVSDLGRILKQCYFSWLQFRTGSEVCCLNAAGIVINT